MKVPGVRYVLAALTGAMIMHTFNVLFGDFGAATTTTPALPADYYQSTWHKYKTLHDFGMKSMEKNNNNNNNNNNNIPSSSAAAITLLPSKLYTIVGLESSGTTFVSKIIGTALKLGHSFTPNGHEGIAVGMAPSDVFVENNKRVTKGENDTNDEDYFFTEVQHVSLPWGLWCTEEPLAWRDNIVPVIYPWLCMRIYRTAPPRRRDRDNEIWQRCQKELMQNHTTTAGKGGLFARFQNSNKPWFPPRHFLNISSHYDWYKQQGVDIHLIIVIRDNFISRTARAEHCGDPPLAEKEETTGNNIINEAIQRYILTTPPANNDTSDSNNNNHHDGIIASQDNKVMVVSYEMLNRFKDDYLQMMYDRLGITSTYSPEWKDGNTKYVDGSGGKHGAFRDKFDFYGNSPFRQKDPPWGRIDRINQYREKQKAIWKEKDGFRDAGSTTTTITNDGFRDTTTGTGAGTPFRFIGTGDGGGSLPEFHGPKEPKLPEPPQGPEPLPERPQGPLPPGGLPGWHKVAGGGGGGRPKVPADLQGLRDARRKKEQKLQGKPNQLFTKEQLERMRGLTGGNKKPNPFQQSSNKNYLEKEIKQQRQHYYYKQP